LQNIIGSLSIHQNIIHLVAALNVAFIIHHHDVSGLANTDSRQKLRKKGTKNLITRFRFRRSGAGPLDPNCRSHQPTGLSPPPGSLRYLPAPRKEGLGGGVTLEPGGWRGCQL